MTLVRGKRSDLAFHLGPGRQVCCDSAGSSSCCPLLRGNAWEGFSTQVVFGKVLRYIIDAWMDGCPDR